LCVCLFVCFAWLQFSHCLGGQPGLRLAAKHAGCIERVSDPNLVRTMDILGTSNFGFWIQAECLPRASLSTVEGQGLLTGRF
jgi:hypothetical protein